MKYYLAGGAVRDFLLGRIPREYDYVFDAPIEDFLRAHPQTRTVGKSVQVFILDNREYMPLRSSLDNDLLSRDFTINALLLEENGVLHAHPYALHDLQTKVLRPVSATAMQDDPVRIFRAARFAAQFPDFIVHPDLSAQMHAVAQSIGLKTIPVERINREFLKALAAPRPSLWLKTLNRAHCLNPWFYPFKKALTIPTCPPQYHKGTVFDHACTVMDAVAGNPLAVWMALCHDLGKTNTPREMLPHHFNHTFRGIALSEQLAETLALPRIYCQAGRFASQWHMIAGMYAQLRTSTQRDLLWQLHLVEQIPNFIESFLQVVTADSGHAVDCIVEDLAFLRTLHLPEEYRNPDGISGKFTGKALKNILYTLQCQALAQRKRLRCSS